MDVSVLLVLKYLNTPRAIHGQEMTSCQVLLDIPDPAEDIAATVAMFHGIFLEKGTCKAQTAVERLTPFLRRRLAGLGTIPSFVVAASGVPISGTFSPLPDPLLDA